MSYLYKLNRIYTHYRFILLNKFGQKYYLSTEEIAIRNRGDPKLSLDESRVRPQFEILDRYFECFVSNFIKNNKTFSVLDVGCRDGYLLQKLSDYGVSCLKGFEIVPEWVEYCHRNNRKYVENVNLLDIDTVQYGQFDIVFSRHTLEHVDRAVLFFDKLISMTKIHGVLFIVFPLNPRPSFKHPSLLKSLEHINDTFDFSRLEIKYFGLLREFSLRGDSINLVDEREESEILIYAKKIVKTKNRRLISHHTMHWS